MTKSKKRYGELRYVDLNKYNNTIKKGQRKGLTRRGCKSGWNTIAWIDCKKEDVTVFDTNKLSVEDMEEIIIYIKLNREIWRRFTYPSANVLGLSVKKRMSVADTKRLPVESFFNKRFALQDLNEGDGE